MFHKIVDTQRAAHLPSASNEPKRRFKRESDDVVFDGNSRCRMRLIFWRRDGHERRSVRHDQGLLLRQRRILKIAHNGSDLRSLRADVSPCLGACARRAVQGQRAMCLKKLRLQLSLMHEVMHEQYQLRFVNGLRPRPLLAEPVLLAIMQNGRRLRRVSRRQRARGALQDNQDPDRRQRQRLQPLAI